MSDKISGDTDYLATLFVGDRAAAFDNLIAILAEDEED